MKNSVLLSCVIALSESRNNWFVSRVSMWIHECDISNSIQLWSNRCKFNILSLAENGWLVFGYLHQILIFRVLATSSIRGYIVQVDELGKSILVELKFSEIMGVDTQLQIYILGGVFGLICIIIIFFLAGICGQLSKIKQQQRKLHFDHNDQLT